MYKVVGLAKRKEKWRDGLRLCLARSTVESVYVRSPTLVLSASSWAPRRRVGRRGQSFMFDETAPLFVWIGSARGGRDEGAEDVRRISGASPLISGYLCGPAIGLRAPSYS